MKKEIAPASEEAIENVAPQPQGNEVATTPGNALAQPEDNLSGIQGEFGQDDVQVPILSLCQKSGELSETFPIGTWVYDKNFGLTNCYDKQEKTPDDPKARVGVTVLSLKKYWRQNKPFKDEGFAKNWDLEEEAKRTPATDPLGNPLKNEDGSPKFFRRGNDGADTFAEAAIIVFLFEVEDQYAEFFYEGKGYARALYRATNTAWQIAKTMYSGALGAARRHAKKGEQPEVKTYAVNWEIGAMKFVKDKDIYFKPLAANKGRHDEAFIQWIEDEVIAPL